MHVYRIASLGSLVRLFLLQCWYVTESTQGVKQKTFSTLFGQVFTMVVVGLACTVSMEEIMLNLALIFFCILILFSKFIIFVNKLFSTAEVVNS